MMRTSAYATMLFLTLSLAFIAMSGSNAQSPGNAQASADNGQTRAPSSPAEVYWQMLESGASEEEAAAARDRANFELKLKDATPAEIYWLMIEQGASEEEAAAARDRANFEIRMQGATPAEIYWLKLEQGASKKEAAVAMRHASIEQRLADADSPAEVYWLKIEQGASEAEAVTAMEEANMQLRMRDASPAELYWLLLEDGATEEEAYAALKQALRVAQLNANPDSPASSLYVALKDLGYTTDDALGMVDMLPVELQPMGTTCDVYVVKFYWCDTARKSEEAYLNSLCWDQGFGQCFLQTCEAPEKHFYELTTEGGCHSSLPSEDTCMYMAISSRTVPVSCEDPNYIEECCFVETQCSQVEQTCLEVDGHPGCPDCEE